ncbi:MAG: aminotransferase class I/II-fold pyridoxal phosphate-dependent enzyme [Calditrichaeota bacterium]|nr:MAG: aminotransferase class I/II-fold pyridoxal phosphate-dependent enzyme [Calditrichota bacterium]
MQIKSKQPDLPVSIFSVMSALAHQHKAINLSQGFPDFDPDPQLITLLEKHVRAGHNQYAPMPGVAELNRALAEKYRTLYNASYDPKTEITITAGATQALYAAFTATIFPGDEVIVFEPWYDAYLPMIRYNGGIPVTIPLTLPDFRIPWDEVRRCISPQTRAIVINSPHNPGGAVLSQEDIDALHTLSAAHDFWIISDEVYEHIIFDDIPHRSMARYPELARRSIVIGSFGKTFHATGWKVGYALAPEALTRELRKIHQFVTFSVHTPTQHAYAEYMSDPGRYTGLGTFYQKRRDLFLDGLRNSRFKAIRPSGSYFVLADYSAISDAPDVEFAATMTREYGVAVIPTSVFYEDGVSRGLIRFCFAKKEETLNRALEALCRI